MAIAAVAGRLVATIGANVSPLLKNLGKAGGAFGKWTKTVQAGLKASQAAAMKFAKALGIIGVAILAVLGPSEVFRTLIGTVVSLYGSLIDMMLGSLSDLWGPLLVIIAEIVTEVGSEMAPMFKELGKIVGDILIPVFQEFKPEIKLLIKAFLLLVAAGIIGFFITMAFVVEKVGMAVRGASVIVNNFIPALKLIGETVLWLADMILGALGGAWDTLTGIWNSAVAFFTGIFTGIADALKGGINAVIGGIEFIINTFIDVINGIITAVGIPAIEKISLPRLQFGGEVLKTGLAVVHKGEVFSGVGGEKNFGTNITLNFNDGAIRLGGTATAEDARELVDMIREELRRTYGASVNVLR
jgi:phage-related protein